MFEPNHDEFDANMFEDMFKQEMDSALNYLIDNDFISMSWDEDKEEMVFFMTEAQKEKIPDWED